MPTRSLQVVIAGDSKPLGVAAGQANRHMDGVEKSAGRMGKAVKAGFAVAAVGAGALVVGLKKTADAAADAEASMVKVKTIVNNAGISFRAHAKEIDRVIQAHSRLTGFDDEDLAESFANMVRTTGKVNEAFKLNALAADIARAKGIDLAGAQSLLARVYNGSYNGVKRLGIAIEPVTEAQDKLKASTKNATDEQVRAAKAADKTATSQAAIAALQKAFGGQAEAYGKTAAGAQDRFRVALENVQEKLGAKLLPVVGKVANAVAGFLDEIDRGTGAGGRFADAVTGSFERVKTVVSGVAGTISDLVGGFQRGESGARSLAAGLAAVAGGFVAFKVITTVTAGVTALKGAWAGLTGVMAANPIGLVAIAIGAVIGALAIMKANTRDASAASRELNDALRAQADALRAVRDIDVDVAARKANVASANVAVEQAEKRLHTLRKDGKASAVDIKQAEADLQQARVSQKRASRDLGDVEEDSRRKRENANKTIADTRRETRETIAEKERDLDATDRQIGAADDLRRSYGVTSDSVDDLRVKSKRLRDEINKLENRKVEVSVDLVLAPGGGKPFTNPFSATTGDGIGSALRSSVGQMANRAAGSLMGSVAGLKGARPSMAPFAAVGARFGLGVSSGLRRGAITSSGFPSFHGSGEAVDLAGSPSGMLATFRALKSMFGSRLAELIYTPGGAGIKDGHAFTYTGQVAADHKDHVHVAFDTGAPGVGDGIGQIRNLWTHEGGSSSTANMAAAIAMAESGGDPTITHRNSDGTIDRGLWQINSTHGAMSTFDRAGNARAAISISGNGRNWNPWTVFKTGAYKRFLSGGAVAKGHNAPGATSGAPEGIPRERPLPGLTSADIRAGRDPSALFSPWNPQDLKGLPEDLRPPTAPMAPWGKADLSNIGGIVGQGTYAAPTPEDFALSAIARARLTDDKGDDAAALRTLLGIRKTAMDAALSDSDPRNDGDAIDAYLQVVEALKANTESNDETNRLAQERLDVDRTIADQGAKIIALGQRTGDLQAQFLAWILSAAGGRVALGMQAAGTPGVPARY